MSHEEIALALGVDRNTLAKYFEHELSVGAYQRRAEVMEALHAAAKKGNVSAAKAYASLTPHVAAPPSPQPDAPLAEPQQTAPASLGKKEQAQRDATTAQVGTDWESLLRPQAPLQ